MWMFGRTWLPPSTVIAPLVSACIVSRLTVRSSRMRGDGPQTVAGRMIVVTSASP